MYSYMFEDHFNIFGEFSNHIFPSYFIRYLDFFLFNFKECCICNITSVHIKCCKSFSGLKILFLMFSCHLIYFKFFFTLSNLIILFFITSRTYVIVGMVIPVPKLKRKSLMFSPSIHVGFFTFRSLTILEFIIAWGIILVLSLSKWLSY